MTEDEKGIWNRMKALDDFNANRPPKYKCGSCGAALSYSPRNYASRPNDIVNPCTECKSPGYLA